MAHCRLTIVNSGTSAAKTPKHFVFKDGLVFWETWRDMKSINSCQTMQ
jgi:hypothetical protein